MKPLNIVLYEPEIPANTGNIGRTCVATGTRLHLIEPLGFRLNDKTLQRAGMDYWKQLDVARYDDWADFVEINFSQGAEADEQSGAKDGSDGSDVNAAGQGSPKLYFASTKAKHRYSDVKFNPGDFIVFGKESAGIPEEILIEHPEECIRIPMNEEIRSLNLSNSVAIVLYEALRQNDFENMQTEGELHRLHW